MSIKHWVVLLILLTVSVHAADWVQVDIKETWDRRGTGFCPKANQCLINNAHSDSYNEQPDRYWSETSSDQRPKCIAPGQFISDHYCENGQWTSRTKQVALQLLAVGLGRTPEDFAIYCDKYDKVLNKYDYVTSYGSVTSFLRKFCFQPGKRRLEPCANNICVLRHGNAVAFGFASNTDISGEKSPLRALNVGPKSCDTVKNNDQDYDACGNNVWYNHDAQSLIYAPGISTLTPVTAQTQSFLTVPFGKLKDYVFGVVHKPDITQYNYTFFTPDPDYNYLYITKNSANFAYSFKQEDVTLSKIDYAGWYYSNINLPEDTCARLIKRQDSRANCEKQPSPTEFHIVAEKRPQTGPLGSQRPSLVDFWADLIKIRVNP